MIRKLPSCRKIILLLILGVLIFNKAYHVATLKIGVKLCEALLFQNFISFFTLDHTAADPKASPLTPVPVVDPCMDRERNADQRDCDEHPAQGVEVWRKGQDGGLGFR